MKAFYGQGDLFADRFTSAGVPTGLVKWGNTDSFELETTAEIKELKSKGRHTFGQTIATVSIPGAATVKATQNEFDRKMLAISFLGTDTDYSQSVDSVTGETIIAKLGKWIELEKDNVSAVAITGQTADKYEVNAELGMIKPLVGSGITEGAELIVAYEHAAQSGYEIAGMTESVIKCRFVFQGYNRVSGQACRVEVYQADVSPASPIDFMADDFATAEISGSMVTPAAMTSPFSVRMLE